MISEQTLIAVAPYALALDAAGVGLEPVNTTPLAAMCAAYLSAPCCDGPDGHLQVSHSSIVAASRSEQHAGTMTAVVNMIAPAVKEHIRIAQAVVNPVVTAVMDRVEEVAKYFVSRSVSDLQVARISMAPPLLLPNLIGVIESFTPSETLDMGAMRVFPNRTDAQLLEQMKVGNTAVDDVLAKWFYAQPERLFQRVWQSFFLSVREQHTKDLTLSFKNTNWLTPEGTAMALALFMWANRLHDAPPADLDHAAGYSLASYNNFMVDMRAQAARRLTNIMEVQTQREESGSLVSSLDFSNKIIYVNDAVYLKWLDKSAGSNEILYGLLVTGDRLMMATDITAAAPRYLKAFYDYSQSAAAAAQIEWGTNMRKTLLECISEQIHSAEVPTNAKTLAYATARKMVMDLAEERMRTDLYDATLEIVHAALFPGTASIVILKGINEAKKSNNALHVREAATVSILRYICSYLAGSIKIVDASARAL